MEQEVGQVFIGKDGLEYAEVYTFNPEIGDFDMKVIPTSALQGIGPEEEEWED